MVTPQVQATIDIDGLAVFYETERSCSTFWPTRWPTR